MTDPHSMIKQGPPVSKDRESCPQCGGGARGCVKARKEAKKVVQKRMWPHICLSDHLVFWLTCQIFQPSNVPQSDL